MTPAEKQVTYNLFLQTWGSKLETVPNIINQMVSHTSVNIHLPDVKPVTMEQLHQSQCEWVSLVAQFNSPLEKDFFKSYWVPIQYHAYDIFMDMSTLKCPIFKTDFYFIEPYHWFKLFIINNSTGLLRALESKTIEFDRYVQNLVFDDWNILNATLAQNTGKSIADYMQKECLNSNSFLVLPKDLN